MVRFASITLLIAVLVTAATAQVPRTISYQGLLTGSSGEPISSGEHTLKVMIYDLPTGGSALFSETQSVSVNNGLFNMIIGSTTPIPASLGFNRPYYLGIVVDNGAELTPRTPLTASPYTLHAATAHFADSSVSAYRAMTAGRADIADDVSSEANVVRSINGLSGTVQLVGGANTTISQSGSQVIVSSTAPNAAGIKEVRTTGSSLQVLEGQGPVVTMNILPGGIGTRELAENSVGSLILRDGAVTSLKIANAAIEEPKLANGAVTTQKISDGSVTSAKIADGSVATADIANGAVTLAKINTTGASSGQSLVFDGTNLTYGFPSGGALALPFSKTQSDPSTLFSLSNSGAGGAGSFVITNSGSGANALTGTSAGSGSGVLASSSGSGNALTANTSGAGNAVAATHSGASGRVGYFQLTNSSNASAALEVISQSSVGNSIVATTVGGTAVAATTTNGSGVTSTSSLGRAGVFTITNSVNTSNALVASTTGTGVGISGTSTSGFGIFGTGSTSRAGVIGSTAATATYLGGSGVAGFSDAAYGTSGVSNTGMAVLGYSNGTAWGGYFVGNVLTTGSLTVNGTLSKAAGTFKIDHPLDPENKYLYHSFVESPDMMNIYNGMIILDADGTAEVELPAWFESLNREFRYQLTAIGSPGPNLYIAEKIHGNRFRIAGGMPGQEVSWEVTGIRHDRYAERYRVQVEVEKAPADRGKYLHPELYSQPRAAGIGMIPPPQTATVNNQ